MAAGIQLTNYVPQFLFGVNSPSPTLAAEVVTGAPIPTGAFPGNAFYLTEIQANQITLGQANQGHAGWYMVVQVDPTATAANIAFGTVGHQSTIAGTLTAPGGLLVTSADKGIGQGINPVVFLGAVTPGNYTIVQVAGDGQLLASAAITPVGSLLAYATGTGKVAVLGAASNLNAQNTIAGLAKATTAGAGLVRVEIAFPWGVI